MNTEEQAVVETTPTPAPKRTKRVIAIIAGTAALAAAIQAKLAPRNANAEFVHVTKISDRPDGSEIASVGMPAFIPGQNAVVVHAAGSRMLDRSATPDERSAQWEVIRNPESTTEEILAELGNFQEYQVLPGNIVKDTKLALSDIKVAIAEAKADNDTERLAEAYRVGYETLLATLG